MRGLFRVVLAACGWAEWMTMRKFSKHMPEQIVVKLEKAEALRGEGMSVAQACRVLGISEATLCRWRQRYGSMSRSEAKELRELRAHSDRRTLCQARDHTHAERQQPDGNPPKRRADHTDHTVKRRRAAVGRVRHLPRALKTAGVEVRSSSRTSTSTREPRPTPGHPHSTRKSRLIT